MALLTFVIVTKNDKFALAKTLKSISLHDERIAILIKDCISTDGTREYIESIKDNNITVVSKSDKGIYDGMNQSLKYVKTEYLNFLNAGETLFPDSIDIICDCLKNRPRIVKFLVETENGEIRKERAGYLYFTKHMLNHQGIVYNIDCFRLNNFDAKMKIIGDLKHLVELNLWKSLNYCDRLIVKYQGGGMAANFNSIGINWNERKSVFKWKKVDLMLKILIFIFSIFGIIYWKFKSLYKV